MNMVVIKKGTYWEIYMTNEMFESELYGRYYSEEDISNELDYLESVGG